MNFVNLKNAVAKQFAEMIKSENAFETSISGDDLWNTYLKSFPEGSNPIYRERTQHDCSCCKHFIRTIGGMVSIVNGKIQTIWDGAAESDIGFYKEVAQAMADLVRSGTIVGKFLHFEKTVGTDKSFEATVSGEPKRWDHFHLNLPPFMVAPSSSIGTLSGEFKSTFDVFYRGLTELTPDSLDTFIELTNQGSLYRGDEYLGAVKAFRDLQKAANKSEDLKIFAWMKVGKLIPAVTRLRNTAVGTFLIDVSNDVDLEVAVRKYEAVMAPANYKRPVAIVTKKQIDAAKKVVNDLGIATAFDRRLAIESDLSVNDVIWRASRAAKKISQNAFDDLAPTKAVKAKATVSGIETISIEKFIENVLPGTKSLEVLIENKQAANLMTLVAPSDPTAGNIFKWDNKFSWAYKGDVTDSIKERVKAAGGAVEGDLMCRLAWFNEDDLDFHMYEEVNGNAKRNYDYGHVYFGNRRALSANGGMLDVDANGIDGIRKDPCENIVYKNSSRMRPGEYKLVVNQYHRRSNQDIGFVVEIEIGGQVTTFTHDQRVHGDIHVANIIKDQSGNLTVKPVLKSSSSVKTVWGINTNQFVPVKFVLNSPNHWKDGGGIGNKHTFLMDARQMNLSVDSITSTSERI